MRSKDPTVRVETIPIGSTFVAIEDDGERYQVLGPSPHRAGYIRALILDTEDMKSTREFRGDTWVARD
jgi:hypothetical protein